jgi:phosphoglycerate dehydrogenase-like enzyme
MNTNTAVILVYLPPERFLPEHRERMAQAAKGREIIHTTDRNEIVKLLERIEICLGFGPWDLFAKMPQLGFVQSWGAGVDGLVANPELKEKAVKIANTHGIHKEQLTEHIFAMILAWSRKFPQVFANQKKHEWLRIIDDDVPVIAGKTMLILGYGSIGEHCAKVALSFGMKVIGLRRTKSSRTSGSQNTSTPISEIQIETVDKLHGLLPKADYVVNILPFTQETLNFMAKHEFSLMKNSAVYVNVGRGNTTDEAALIEALKAGKIAAALLDVTVQEPLAPDSPLWDMANVIITPHYAGMRPDYASLAMDITLENLERYNRGEALINQIDKNAGY